jgi:hypothetical protein
MRIDDWTKLCAHGGSIMSINRLDHLGQRGNGGRQM